MVFNRRVYRQNADANIANFIKANVLLTIFIAVVTSPAVLSKFVLPSIEPPADYVKNCAPTYKCDANAKYRQIDGSCNNLLIPWLGATKTPHLRLLKPNYADGQTDCCDLQNANPIPVQCRAVVPVPENDPIYTKLGQTCITFIRAMTSSEAINCMLKPATFMVHTTHFIDGSPIYGSSDNEAKNLRACEGGRLRSEIKNGNEFCPQNGQGDGTVCDPTFNSKVCYVAGDPRVNQNLGIALIQNLMLRFHNEVVKKLQCINNHWDDETLYQEGRKIVIGVLQHMMYTILVPTILGQKFYDDFIKPAVYDYTVIPSTSLEFSAGAFRLLHSLIPESLNLWGKMPVEITKTMNKPDLLPEDDNLNRFIYGFLGQPTRAAQSSYNPLISNFMFNQTKAKFRAQDLLVADMMRGRDVGLRSYKDMRALCGLELLETFEHLVGVIENEDVEILKTLYASFDDVDFIVGASLEKKLENEMFGPTAKCILADSFYRYKVGDSHFYNRLGQPWSFTPEQLEAINYISLSTVICATTGIMKLPENIFVIPDSSTVQYDCKHFPLILDAWKEPTSP